MSLLEAVLSAPPHRENSEDPPTFLYHSLRLSLDQDSILILRGPSGCGKSTVLKQLVGLVECPGIHQACEPTPLQLEGSIIAPYIRLNGTPMNKYNPPDWRQQVLYVPQTMTLPLGTTGNEFWKTVTGYRKHQTNFQSPQEISLKWGLGYDRWDQEWGNLSGGEKQRIGLAIAAALRPTVLLLDEPTSALDLQTTLLVEQDLFQTHASTPKRQACIWITHSDEQTARAKRAVEESGVGSCQVVTMPSQQLSIYSHNE